METCANCNESLHDKDTIFSALGHLFCSRECGVSHMIEIMDVEQLAEYAFAATYEEITPDEAGINPEDVHKCDWCGEDFDRSEVRQTDLGMLCDGCILAIRSRGEEVIEYE